MNKLISSLVCLVFVLGSVLLIAPQQAAAQVAQRCFPETGFCIEGRIREFWEQNGGLPVFGFPIAAQGATKIEGRDLIAQQFERNRLELHPENARPYDVLLGRLGADRLSQQGRDWQTAFGKEGTQGGCRFFPETGHSVCGAILKAWRANGLEIDGKRGKTEAENLALFGLPLSGLVTETLSDGRQYQLQWFERARFEIHPENAPPYDVLLGLLGRETAGGSAQQPTQPGQPANPCADAPQPKNGRIRPSNCFKSGTPIEIDIFGFQPNEQIGYWLTTPKGDIFGTRETLNIGPAGAVNGLPLNTDGLTPGIWYFVFQGVSSGNQSVVYFKIIE